MNAIAVKVEIALPSISTNFEAAKIQLEKTLKQYNLIVDEDSVKASKKMAAEINKLKKEIEDKRKATIAKLSAPLKEFEAKAKELETICESTRQNLVTQVKVYDDKKREKVQKLLKIELASAYSKYEVKPEFQTVKVDDLVIISNLIKSGLAKKAKDAIDARVLEAKKLQEKIDTRLLTLGEICFKCGLNTPLTRQNINHFLYENSDDVYLEKLIALIKNEITRLGEAKKLKERREAAQNQKPQENLHTKEPKVQTNSKYSKMKNSMFAPKSHKKTFIVTATFQVEVDEKLEKKLTQANTKLEDSLARVLVSKFSNAGFKSTPSVHVEQMRKVS